MRPALLLAKPSSGTCTFTQHLGGEIYNTRESRSGELAVPVRLLGGFLDSGQGSGSLPNNLGRGYPRSPSNGLKMKNDKETPLFSAQGWQAGF